jgi:biotin---protein ligase
MQKTAALAISGGVLLALSVGARRRLIKTICRSLTTMNNPSLTAQLCVHASTLSDLQSARNTLSQAEHLITKKASTTEAAEYTTPQFTDKPTSSLGSHCGTFSPPLFFSTLTTQTLGKVLLTTASLPSTQTLIQENQGAIPTGTVCVADKQCAGKGRGDNVWESPSGCLMFSATMKLKIAGQRLPFVQYIVCLTIIQSAKKLIQDEFGAVVDLRIKWPNDLYAGGLKIGGILCHSAYRNGEFVVTVGVGINVSNRQPTTCLEALLENALNAKKSVGGGEGGEGEVDSEGGQQQQQQQGAPTEVSTNSHISREILLATILNRLEPMVETLCEDGFKPFEEDYYSVWLHSGQRVSLQEGGREVGVTIRGLSPHGYLLAVAENEGGGGGLGEKYELHPDGNSLDFFAGLVRKKLETGV